MTEEMKVYKDGDKWIYVLPDFENLQVSPAVCEYQNITNPEEIYQHLMNEKKEG
jgi:uncharacterized protein YjfI (DUF2170 family)